MDYFLHIVVLISVYAVLSISLDLLVGHAGLLSIAHAGFFGVGAYTSAALAVHFGVPFGFACLVGMIGAAILSFPVSLPSLRLHGDYFVISTFGVQMILFSIFNNWSELTGGALGIAGIPQPTVFGCKVDSPWEFAVLSAVFASFSYFVVYRLSNRPFGRVLRAIREDEVLAKALGKNTLRFKMAAFAVSAALAASAGSLYAHYVTYIDPTSFNVLESILVISMVIIGGAGSTWGPLIGAVILVTLPEALRFLGLPGAVAANLRQVFYGSVLVMMMLLRPQGLVGKYRFGR